MSLPTLREEQPVPAPAPELVPHRPRGRRGIGALLIRRLVIALVILIPIAAAVWYGVRAYRALAVSGPAPVPVTTVRRGEVTFTITAKGELKGGNSEMLAAPMVGGEMHITFLRKPGEVVAPGDVVVKFDTTEQQYNLREAESDLAEAEQHVAQAQAQLEAQQEEDSYALLKARSDLRLAELEAKKNPVSAAITARQNDMAVDQARAHLAQLEKNLANRKAANQAGVAMQQAGRGKAMVMADMARRNIASMTLNAQRAGYVAVKQNMSGNFFYSGMELQLYQVGDSARPGMVVAEIPDLKNWEVTANIAELDRGHLAPGQTAEIRIIAIPGKRFTGHIVDLGGTTGTPWDRHFDCHIKMDAASPELRPGMSARILIATDSMKNALWIPAQALFTKDGKTFVYVPSGSGFVTHEVKLLRQSESQAVVDGLRQGQTVALANPEQQARKARAAASASQAISK